MDELDKNRIGERIKNIRKSRGENQTEFAKIINGTLPAVSNWETGRNIPNNERLKAIADLGDISVNELLYGDLKQYIYNVLHEELLEVGRLYHKIIEYLKLTDEEIEKITDPNDRNDVYQIKAEQFLRDNIDVIVEKIKGYSLIPNKDIYNNADSIIKKTLQYTDDLIFRKKNNIIVTKDFTLRYYDLPKLKSIEDFETETKYSFECRISLETYDDIDSRDYVELGYNSYIVVYLYISNESEQGEYLFGGLNAYRDDRYRYIFRDNLYESAKEIIVKEVLEAHDLKKFNLKFEDLEELTL